MVTSIYTDCAHCGATFTQPDDPGRKRRFCSGACRTGAYRARKRRQEQADRDRQRQDQRRRYDGLRAKAASTTYEHEAAACNAKANQLRDKYGL